MPARRWSTGRAPPRTASRRGWPASPPTFEAFDSAADDICLIAFTSGTTGEPKGTLHFQRDLLAICDGFSRQLLRPAADDLFCGSPPLAFTFGLGGLALFPLREGAASLLLEQAAPAQLAEAIATHRPTICFTAPTAWRALAGLAGQHDLSSLQEGRLGRRASAQGDLASWSGRSSASS